MTLMAATESLTRKSALMTSSTSVDTVVARNLNLLSNADTIPLINKISCLVKKCKMMVF